MQKMRIFILAITMLLMAIGISSINSYTYSIDKKINDVNIKISNEYNSDNPSQSMINEYIGALTQFEYHKNQLKLLSMVVIAVFLTILTTILANFTLFAYTKIDFDSIENRQINNIGLIYLSIAIIISIAAIIMLY